ncbi:MAG TPA: D-alanine--poly(phosphoribitol) ligase subunit DltC [Gemmataceae bacterium]|jgi:D-alanine--poly(phosphoribitol) ligase subunit 2|nr:D-alanine--poly(phosphoribitol) ligase subunit DltC [Gemmataceae bacterium]
MSSADQILAVIAHVVDSEEVVSNPDLPLYDLSLLDSLKTVELMVTLSEEFRVEISPAEFERQQWATPRKIVAYLERKMAA